ncbi:hypothetical protein [Methyloceanibacter caenitepidi]|uniref:Glycosyltransferase n=1 Tax=Methyloceanibacter caenitepidi TaxID=1384459 RepID=A0A0A8K5Y4_9HYPH|nr:hypothetical protein [Methyloceanibacter caenitepidi]BAQ18325.1 hypothetical protein GL4_2892 [Methyloceanibacter caenitepidi]
MRSVFIGFDPREADAFAVARHSLVRNASCDVAVRGLVLSDLRARGLYTRPTEYRDGKLWDVISGAPMSTEFACSRFLVPYLAGSGWALFTDADMLFRSDVEELFEQADPSKAVMVVKHDHRPDEGVKMDGQVQTRYARKNWSSVCLWNVDHPSNRGLTLELINGVPGRDLHRFCWLEGEHIGELEPSWNWLAGHSDPAIEPNIVHFTDGVPSMTGYEDTPYADEWRLELERWAA